MINKQSYILADHSSHENSHLYSDLSFSRFQIVIEIEERNFKS